MAGSTNCRLLLVACSIGIALLLQYLFPSALHDISSLHCTRQTLQVASNDCVWTEWLPYVEKQAIHNSLEGQDEVAQAAWMMRDLQYNITRYLQQYYLRNLDNMKSLFEFQNARCGPNSKTHRTMLPSFEVLVISMVEDSGHWIGRFDGAITENENLRQRADGHSKNEMNDLARTREAEVGDWSDYGRAYELLVKWSTIKAYADMSGPLLKELRAIMQSQHEMEESIVKSLGRCRQEIVLSEGNDDWRKMGVCVGDTIRAFVESKLQMDFLWPWSWNAARVQSKCGYFENPWNIIAYSMIEKSNLTALPGIGHL